MERKKKREKPAANGSVGHGTSGQSGDAHGWQREAEQMGVAKRLASSGNSDSPTQHGAVHAFNWSVAQYPSVAQQQSMHTPLLQPPHGQPGAHQQQAQAVPPQGGPSSLAGWQNQDAFSQNASVPPLHFQTGESSWPHPAAPGAQSLGGRPPPFPFPPPLYSGPWDPVAWWGHNPYQPLFPYLYPGYGGGYPCPMPSAPPPIGAIQRGIIKPPAGLSQKHIRIWEAQSMENMQLWTTTTQLWAAVARSDAEIALQRTKILKLESELQLMKAHRDVNMPQSDGTAAHQSGSKRGRRKKALPATSAMTVSAPASDTNALSVPGRRVQAIPYKVDTPPRTDLEEKDKSTLTMPELIYRQPTDDRDQKSCASTVNPTIRNETVPQKHSLRQTLEFQGPTNNLLTIAKDGLAFGHMNHLSSPYKPNNLIGCRKDSHYEQSLKESVAVSFLKTAGSLDHQGVITGNMSYGATINSGSLCPESNGSLMAKDAIVRSQFQQAHNMEKSVPHDLQKTWQYPGEDGSDEQDEGGASVQDDDDGDEVDDEDDENALDDMHSEKVSNLWHSMPFR